MRTPWGNSQTIEKITRGLSLVNTASHGGIKVSPAFNKKIPEWLQE